MTVQDNLELDISTALRAVDELNASLTAATSAFASSLTEALSGLSGANATVAVTADTSSVVTDIDTAVADATPVVTPTADTSALAADIQGSLFDVNTFVPLVADTEPIQLALFDLASVPIVVPVEADTTQAATEIAALSDTAVTPTPSSDSGSSSGSNFNSSAAINAASSAAAAGTPSIASFGGALRALGPEAAAVAAGVAAVGGTIDVLFQSAVKAESAELRFNQTFAETANVVNNIHVGNLAKDLDSLSISVGSNVAATRSSLATFGQLGISAGKTREEVAGTSSEIAALSARAIALNPNLGEMSNVIDKSTIALSRGGRFAASFGISLDALAISEEAKRETGKQLTSELTIYEKAAAGAELATKKYGATLNEIIGIGALNPQLQLKALQAEFQQTLATIGKPLVAPVFDLLRSAQPILQDLGQAIGDVASIAIPIISGAFEALGPIIHFVGEGFHELTVLIRPLTDVIGPLLGGWLALGPAGAAIVAVTRHTKEEMQNYAKTLNETASATEFAAAAQEILNTQVGEADADYTRINTSFLSLVSTQKSYQDSLDSITERQAKANKDVRLIADAQQGYEKALKGVTTAQQGVKDAQQGVIDANKSYQKSLDAVIESEHAHDKSVKAVSDAQKDLLKAEQAVTDARAGGLAAEKDQIEINKAKLDQAKAFDEANTLAINGVTAGLDFEKAQQAAAAAGITIKEKQGAAANRLTDAQDKLTDAQQKVVDTIDAERKSSQAIIDAKDNVEAASRRIEKAQDAVVTATDAVADAQTKVGDAYLKIGEAQDTHVKNLANLRDAQDKVATSAFNLSDAEKAFGAELAAHPESIDAYIQHLRDIEKAHPEAAASIESLITKFQGFKQQATDKGSDIGKGFATGFVGEAKKAGDDQEIKDNFARGIQEIKDNFVPGLKELGRIIVDGTKNFAGNLVGWVDTGRTKIAENITDFGGVVVDHLATIGNGILTGVENFADNLTGWIGTAVTEAPGKLLDFAKGLGTAFLDVGKEIALDVAGFAGFALGWIAKAVLDAPAKLGELLTSFQTWAKDTAISLAFSGAELVTGIFNGVLDKIKNPGKFFGDIKDNFIAGLGTVGEWLTGVGNSIFDGLKSGFLGAINLLKTVGSFAADVRDNFISGLGVVKDWLTGLGNSVFDGLKQGVLDAVTSGGKFFSDLKDEFVKKFKEGFGINSPAKSMLPIGSSLAEGMMLGLSDGSSGIVDAAAQIAKDAQDALVGTKPFNLDLSTSLGTLATPQGAPIAGSVNSLGSSASPVVGQLTVEIHIPADVSDTRAKELGSLAGNAAISEIRTQVLRA